MSDRPIQVDDLVRVAHDCCGAWYGQIFSVTGFTEPVVVCCPRCQIAIRTVAAINGDNAHPHANSGAIYFAPISWLKRIPPLGELEGEDVSTREPEEALLCNRG